MHVNELDVKNPRILSIHHLSSSVFAQSARHQHPASARVQDGGGEEAALGPLPLRSVQDLLGHAGSARHHLRGHRGPLQRGLPRSRPVPSHGLISPRGHHDHGPQQVLAAIESGSLQTYSLQRIPRKLDCVLRPSSEARCRRHRRRWGQEESFHRRRRHCGSHIHHRWERVWSDSLNADVHARLPRMKG